MNSNLLIKGDSKQPLDAFVSSLAKSIGQANWEERQSSSNVEEWYFRSFVLGVELTAALADLADERADGLGLGRNLKPIIERADFVGLEVAPSDLTELGRVDNLRDRLAQRREHAL
jgi:hypothetical protein